MSILVLPRHEVAKSLSLETPIYSGYALLSIVFAGLFLGYVIGSQARLFHTSLSYPMIAFYVVIAPGLAMAFSIISLRQNIKMQMRMRGVMFAYFAFFVSTLYFVVALAMPIVLIGLYLMYTYIW